MEDDKKFDLNDVIEKMKKFFNITDEDIEKIKKEEKENTMTAKFGDEDEKDFTVLIAVGITKDGDCVQIGYTHDTFRNISVALTRLRTLERKIEDKIMEDK